VICTFAGHNVPDLPNLPGSDFLSNLRQPSPPLFGQVAPTPFTAAGNLAFAAPNAKNTFQLGAKKRASSISDEARLKAKL
jgi:hypothetical protein